MLKLIFAGLLLLCAPPSYGQSPTPPRPIEERLGREWQAVLLAQEHFVETLRRLLEERDRLAAERDKLLAEKKQWEGSKAPVAAPSK